jgi:hypothetical protein
MLMKKHTVYQLIAMKTRGQLTAIGVPGEPELLAKAGVKPPCEKPEHNEYMVDLYLNREPNQMTDNSHLISTSEQWLTESDLVMLQKEKRLNLEFDWKRRLVNPRMVKVRDTEHIAFDSVPWDTLEHGERARTLFDGWRENNCLKTLDDWESWEDYYESANSTSGKGIKVTEEGSVGILRRVFLRAYTRDAWSVNAQMSYKALAQWLTSCGYYTTSDECKNAKRAKLPEQAVPVTTRALRLLAHILTECPDIEIDKLFAADRINEVHRRLNELSNAQNIEPAPDKTT